MSKSRMRAAAMKRGGGAAVALVLSATAYAQSGTVNRAISEQAATEQAAQQAQQTVDKLDNETRQAVAEYRATIQETDSLKRYNDQLASQVQSQVDEMAAIQRQLGEVDNTAREIMPLLSRMLQALEEFVKLDLPFLMDERAQRIGQLKEMMSRADVSVAEKYRRIIEAYQVEMEYGRTLESYQGKVGDKTVDFLRAGRVALMYQTLDGGETGYWDAGAKAWQVDSDYKDAVRSGLKIAKKQAAPDLLVIPVSAPKEAK